MKKILLLLIIVITVYLFTQTTGGSGSDNDWELPGEFSWGEFAEGTMGFKDSSVVVTLTQNNWAQITNGGNNLFGESGTSQNVTLSNDQLILEKNGVYWIAGRLSCTVATKKNIKMTLMQNGSTEKACNVFEIAADKITFSTFGKLTVTTAPDTLDMRVMNTESNDDITVYCGAVRVMKVRPN